MRDEEHLHLATAVAALGDALAACRLDQIERALKFDPDPAYRRQLVREYLDLTDNQKECAA